MSNNNLSFGKSGETLAVEFLKRSGYRIWLRNYRNRLGEIDIIAWDKDTLCFIEVKRRSSLRFGLPQEALSLLKQKQISKLAVNFLNEKKVLNKNARFDVVSILSLSSVAEIKLIKNAFEYSYFA